MSQFVIIFTEKALTEIELAVSYYRTQKDNLGKEFAEQVYTTIYSLKKSPYISAIRYSDIRCAIVKRFPFLVHYSVDEANKMITILAVFNTHKKPFW